VLQWQVQPAAIDAGGFQVPFPEADEYPYQRIIHGDLSADLSKKLDDELGAVHADVMDAHDQNVGQALSKALTKFLDKNGINEPKQRNAIGESCNGS